MRLIFVPQYPTRLRYQEFWYELFPKQFEKYFTSVVILGKNFANLEQSSEKEMFSPVNNAVLFELQQMKEYFELTLTPNDILFHADLSFPGLFQNIFFYKRPPRIYSFCHATSINNYDYFSQLQKLKFPIETVFSYFCNKVFVGSKYHADKLGWKNTQVVGLPIVPNITNITKPTKVRNHLLTSVCRPTYQKVNEEFEKEIEKKYKTIFRPQVKSWAEYEQVLYDSKALLITTREDTFNYTLLDCVACGVVPIAPRNFCFPEILPDEYLYSSFEECCNIINKVKKNELSAPTSVLCQELVDNFFQNICTTMLKG